MILALCAVLAAVSPGIPARVVAVLPLETGALDGQTASALEQEARAAVVQVLGEGGLVSADAQREGLAGLRLAPAEAARKLSATHVLTATTRRMEGALAVTWSLVSSEGKTIKTARLVGFTPAEVRADARTKIENLLREAFGLAPPRVATAAGTLRMPGAMPAQNAPGNALAAAPQTNPAAAPVPVPQPSQSLESI